MHRNKLDFHENEEESWLIVGYAPRFSVQRLAFGVVNVISSGFR